MAAVANNIVELGEGGGTSLGEVDRTRRGGERVLGLGGGRRGGGKASSLVYNKRKREGKRKKGPRLVRETTTKK